MNPQSGRKSVPQFGSKNVTESHVHLNRFAMRLFFAGVRIAGSAPPLMGQGKITYGGLRKSSHDSVGKGRLGRRRG